MSGRHRAQTTGARRVLAGTVPVLGLAGVVTAAVGSTAHTTPVAEGTALVTTPIPTPNPVGLEQPDLGIGPDVTTVAADASKAAGEAGAQQREQERRAVDALVMDVRDDARARDAVADRQGRERLDAFRQDVDQLRKADRERADSSREDSRHDPESEPSCSWSGHPRMGGSTHGDEIVGRDCGLVDMFGKQRSTDPWIDGQLLNAQGDDD